MVNPIFSPSHGRAHVDCRAERVAYLPRLRYVREGACPRLARDEAEKVGAQAEVRLYSSRIEMTQW